MPNFVDLTGMKFGRWLVIKRGKNGNYKATRWECVCECGNEKLVNGSNLINGKSKSCGCLHSELVGKITLSHGYARKNKKNKTYTTWISMRQRCNNPKSEAYKYYGGRGISICERWNNFENFLKDMGERPENLTLERENNDGNYEPGNCKWATHEMQSRNNRWVKLNTLKVQVIKKLLAESSLTQKAIANIFSVTETHIGYIKSNKLWGNVQYKPV